MPKSHELLQMGHRQPISDVDLKDLPIVGKLFAGSPILPLAEGKNGWRNMLCATSLRPRDVPKTSFFFIANGDLGHHIEEVHIIEVARALQTHPRPIRSRPLEPWPTEPQGPIELGHVEDAKAPISVGSIDRYPINLTLSTCRPLFIRPKETSNNLLDGSKGFHQNVKSGERAYRLRGEHRLDESLRPVMLKDLPFQGTSLPTALYLQDIGNGTA